MNSGQSREPSSIQFDHEGQILDAALHPSEDEMASLDTEGQVICRQVKSPDTLICCLTPLIDLGVDEKVRKG